MPHEGIVLCQFYQEYILPGICSKNQMLTFSDIEYNYLFRKWSYRLINSFNKSHTKKIFLLYFLSISFCTKQLLSFFTRLTPPSIRPPPPFISSSLKSKIAVPSAWSVYPFTRHSINCYNTMYLEYPLRKRRRHKESTQ